MTTTEFDPLASTAPMIVYVDIKSPYAFVAIKPIMQIEDALDVQFDWRPITLDIPSYLGTARLDKDDKVVESNRTPQQWGGVRYAYKDARRYAALNGDPLRGTTKIWDTSLAHMGFAYAKAQGPQILRLYLMGVYPRFWQRDFGAEDLATVSAALAQAGADVTGFAAYCSGPGRETHDAEQAAIFDAGIYGVPTFVIEGEFLFGREHLPYLVWRLTGAQGQQPDIAYGNTDELIRRYRT